MNSAYNSNVTSSNGTKDFLNSNSIVAKISFLFFVIFAFVIILQLSITVITWFFNPADSPKLITGMIDATQMITIAQDPATSGSKTIYRSVNSTDGIEFTWSIWLYINDLGNPNNKYQHIFHKGNDSIATTGLNFPNNAPGLYISPNTNELTVIMNTYEIINEEITIPDIPLNKWINVMIRCQNTKLDIYINGLVAKSITLIGVPKQNYGDVYIAMNGGFNGNISNLWYYNYALGTAAIQNLVVKGPDTTVSSSASSTMLMKNPNYLSLRWYFYGNSNTSEFN